MSTQSVKSRAAEQLPAALAELAAKKSAAETPAVTISAEEAAKAVRRLVAKRDKEGKETGEVESVKVTADELFAWSVRGDRVVVVTVDGQKLEGAL